MGKMVEVKMHGLFCEFAGPQDDEVLELKGSFKVLRLGQNSNVDRTEVVFDFPSGPKRMRKGDSLAINKAVSVALATPITDPGPEGHFVKFGGELTAAGFLPNLFGERFETLHANDINNSTPLIWRLYFGKNSRIMRADFSTAFLHPL